MKTEIASIVVGLALACSASAFAAAGDMGNMDMSGSSAHKASSTAASMSHGEVKKVDTSAGKLTIKHGPLENLGMEGMTMVFRVKDPAMIAQVKAGDKIDFVAEDLNGALTVTKLQVQ
ncbi:copper-binding protein [Cupriavidus basilensis]|uniref:copper-binding protein n=1 Tax=Cupriavidus basilensis TaxID=68895 RepID=UPI0023E80578|nr:copper-binding protein [Cupriavidus basilensis]MDF3885095.1 copper-binding protein [Cupriavidus basilensis]